MTTSRIKACLALGGMFLLGAVTSAGVYHTVARRDDAKFFSGDRSKFEARLVEAMGRELDLSDAQRASVRGIFEKHADERKRLFRQEIFEALRTERRRRLFGEPAK